MRLKFSKEPTSKTGDIEYVLKDTVLRSPGIRSGFYHSKSDLAIFYVGYGLPHRVLIMGLSPYTIYLQEAINTVDCQKKVRSGRFAERSSTDLLSTSSNYVVQIPATLLFSVNLFIPLALVHMSKNSSG
jgi:hypothetical protein